MLGFQQANEKKERAIVNIDEEHFPTYLELIQFARSIKGNNARKHIYMAPAVADLIISKYSNTNSNNALITVDQEARLRIAGIPVTESDNFIDGEDAIPAEAIA